MSYGINIIYDKNIEGDDDSDKDEDWITSKLDGVGPVDKRPSTNKLHHFVRKKEKKCDM